MKIIMTEVKRNITVVQEYKISGTMIIIIIYYYRASKCKYYII